MSHKLRVMRQGMRRCAPILLLGGLIGGCEAPGGGKSGGGTAEAVTTVRGAGAAAAPSPGFTSALGTVAAGVMLHVATAAEANSMAPRPTASLDSLLGAEETVSIRALSPGTGREVVMGSCLVCHSVAMITQQHKDSTAWIKTVTQMIAWGAPVPTDKRDALVAYLVQHYPARVGSTSMAPVGTPQPVSSGVVDKHR
jgi:cytochrome c5